MYNIIFDKKSPKYEQLYDYIRYQIINGGLAPNTRLPSIRELVLAIGVSKTTVETAYRQLKDEGYIKSSPKSGYYVEKIDVLNEDKSKNNNSIQHKEQLYINDRMDDSIFVFSAWQKSLSKVLNYDQERLLYSPSPFGELELRKEIATFSSKYRGTDCTYNHVVIGAGVQSLLRIIIGLVSGDKIIARENPGFSFADYIFLEYGFDIKKIPVTSDGIDMNVLRELNPNIVYTSPSYQYPTGTRIPISKRIKLSNWAKENNRIIIEDDYNSILSYEHKPHPSLQGLNHGQNVFYLGSLSKILLPSIRISYMIIPDSYIDKLNEIIFRYKQGVSKVEQLALYEFMISGNFDRHIRRVRKVYREKNIIIRDQLSKIKDKELTFLGLNGGVSFIIKSNNKNKLDNIIKKGNDILISLKYVNNSDELVVFNYSGIKTSDLRTTIDNIFNN